MQRINVDLPDPEGPQMTMRSPLATARSMSRSTWNSPYNLLTFLNAMMDSLICIVSAHVAHVEVPLDPLAVARHGKAEQPVDRGNEEVAFQVELPPVGVPA